MSEPSAKPWRRSPTPRRPPGFKTPSVRRFSKGSTMATRRSPPPPGSSLPRHPPKRRARPLTSADEKLLSTSIERTFVAVTPPRHTGDMCDRLSELRGALERYALDVDVATFSASDAALALAHATAIKNMATTVEALFADRAAESNEWKRAGERSAAHHLAKKTGTGVGNAASTLETAKRLKKLPDTAAARKGDLSPQQASIIADAASAAPGAEGRLLEQAKTASLPELRDE